MPTTRPLLRISEEGESQLSASGSFNGLQLDGAYVVSDGWALRGAAGMNVASGSGMASAEAGFGRITKTSAKPAWLEGAQVVWGVFADAGAGVGTSARDRLLTGSAVAQTQLRWQHGGLGAALRARYAHLVQAPREFVGRRRGQGLLVEPVMQMDVGLKKLTLFAQAGVSYPLWHRGDLGSQWPIIVACGLSYVPESDDASRR